MSRMNALFSILGQRHKNADLARALGVSRMQLSRWRHGPTHPSTTQCAVIASYTAELMYPGRPEASAILPELLRWIRGEDVGDEEEGKILDLLRRQLIEAPNEIAVLRARSGLSAKAAAAALGLTRQSLHTWEHTEPTPERIAACKAAWGVS